MVEQTSANNTVFVACKVPAGQKFRLKNGNFLVLEGPKDIRQSKGFVITEVKVPEWEEVQKTYGSMDLFKNGVVFSTKSESESLKEGKNRESEKTGQEQIDPAKQKTKPAKA